MAGIRCEFCSYMFDEALLMRERAEQARARERAEFEAERERAKADNLAAARAANRRGP